MARRLGHLYDQLKMDEGEWIPRDVAEIEKKIKDERLFRGVANTEASLREQIRAYRKWQGRIRADGDSGELEAER